MGPKRAHKHKGKDAAQPAQSDDELLEEAMARARLEREAMARAELQREQQAAQQIVAS